ncbi:Maf family protein [Paenibacillus campi]|uniref:Maf family protein n=1 Tax=Paenibacillus campi TaxID=3106031 RepID=UPI002AFF42DC|nr:Maf family protein [Paenibacillus sp. SGZ-1009]
MSRPHLDRMIVLASASPRRKELMASLQLEFEVVPSDADESVPSEWTPEQVVTELALRKANAIRQQVQARWQDALIIGSDTIVVLDGRIFGKPAHEAESAAMLTMLQGRMHHVYTGIACVDAATGHTRTDYSRTSVHMKPLTPERIRAYVHSGEPADKAGSYAIQGIGSTLVERIEGCYFTVVGLPVPLLSDMLEEFGVSVLEA